MPWVKAAVYVVLVNFDSVSLRSCLWRMGCPGGVGKSRAAGSYVRGGARGGGCSSHFFCSCLGISGVPDLSSHGDFLSGSLRCCGLQQGKSSSIGEN